MSTIVFHELKTSTGNVNYINRNINYPQNVNWKCQLLQKRQLEMSTAPKTSTKNVNCVEKHKLNFEKMK